MGHNGNMSFGFIELDDCWNKIGVWGDSESRCKRLEKFVHCHNCPVYSQAARRLLDRELPEDYVREWTRLLANPKEFEWSSPYSAFVFRIGTEWLAFPSFVIREVIAMGRIHKVPHRNRRLLRGLVNVRGKLEICVSVGTVLGIKPDTRGHELTKFSDRERLVVAEKDGYCVVFPVSEVRGIFHYSSESVSDPPVSVTGSKQAYATGMLKLDDIEVGMIDEELFFDTVKKGLV